MAGLFRQFLDFLILVNVKLFMSLTVPCNKGMPLYQVFSEFQKLFSYIYHQTFQASAQTFSEKNKSLQCAFVVSDTLNHNIRKLHNVKGKYNAFVIRNKQNFKLINTFSHSFKTTKAEKMYSCKNKIQSFNNFYFNIVTFKKIEYGASHFITP